MKTCLIVDDSSVVRKVARRIIEDIGFSCLEAEDGTIACKICADAMPDAIVLDWNMPIMSGIEFLEKLRAMPGGEKPKVIFCSTENDMSFIKRAMDAGADEYIMKPFDTDILVVKFSQIGLL
jgi:two-component system chemotaxis response regulator CheY